MTPITINPPALTPPFEDVGELLERLGNIPPHRIRMSPAPGLATEADLLAAMEAPRKRLCELIDGVLVEKAVGMRESLLAVWVFRLLDDFVRARNLGMISVADGPCRLTNDRIRMPDIGFFAWDRLPGGRIPDQPIPSIVPNLAIEILSISNTPAEMLRKRRDYFGAGVILVWELDPRTRTISIYSDPTTFTVLRDGDTLDGGTVLPGFTVPVQHIFAELDRHR
jgi:Uma2 family endonuclease